VNGRFRKEEKVPKTERKREKYTGVKVMRGISPYLDAQTAQLSRKL